MTIYSLMNKVHTLRFYVLLAVSTYRENQPYYSRFEDCARASLETLLDVDYINVEQFNDLGDQLSHVFRMYKKGTDY